MPDRACHCLYCGARTGTSDVPGRKTVCSGCANESFRDEALEVAAGMRPWARPLVFWVKFFGQTALPDDVAAIAQEAWEERVRQGIEQTLRPKPPASVQFEFKQRGSTS